MLLADIVGPAKVGDRQRVLRGQLPVARTAALVAPQRLDGIHATRLTHELATLRHVSAPENRCRSPRSQRRGR